jgi:hypothetical protein
MNHGHVAPSRRVIEVALLLVTLLSAVAAGAQTFDRNVLRPAGYHPSEIAYYNVPYFADAFALGQGWLEFTESEFGTPVDTRSTQFDENGYPRSLNAGRKLRAILFGLNADSPFRPAGWPARDALARGRIVVTWKGNADIRLVNGTFAAEGSSGTATGSLVDGRRIYFCTGPEQSTQSLEIHAIAAPVTEIHVWLATPDDPATLVKENETGSLEGQFFHPLLLQRIADADWGFIRFMDWGATNASPQQDWADRRLPSHAFRSGVLNERSPGGGSEGNRSTGVAFEHMVMLCNQTGRNLWINVPHLASNDFITKLAQLIRFGSDGRNPYTSAQTNPQFAPLRSDLLVFVEYSNEIWSSGFSFPQGNWAEAEASAHGLTKPQFNARRFCDTWKIFQQTFAGTTRLVRVAAVFTGLEAYTRPFLAEIGTYGSTLSPAVRPDVMAVTTYFGNGIQDFVREQHFGEGKLFNDPYWASAAFENERRAAFDEWTRRILAGDTAQGGGFDTTGIGGGFATSLHSLPAEVLGYPLPLIAYEGGPSLYTDSIDGGAANDQGVPTDDHVTTFIEAMNRDPRISTVYDIHLNLAKSKGLWTHTPFTDAGIWSKFGQWGHLETLDQKPSSSPKYARILQHVQEFSAIRNVDVPLGATPGFSTTSLPIGLVNQSYSTEIATSGGDAPRAATVIGAYLDRGLTAAPVSSGSDRIRISGTPATSQKSYVLARVVDRDGDPAWRIYTLETFGGPGTIVQSDFRGTSPALAAPFRPTYVLDSKVLWGGWRIGRVSDGTRGVEPREGDGAFVFSVNAPQEADGSLTQAIAEDEYITATITPAHPPLDLRGAEIRFSTRRIDFHSPRGYAVATNLTGFNAPALLYTSDVVSKDDFTEVNHVLRLPSTQALAAIAVPLEIRIYAFGAQFEGHRTSLSGFKLTEVVAPATPTRRRVVRR